MAKHTLKILRCKHRKIFKVCLAIFQHYAIKGKELVDKQGQPKTVIQIKNKLRNLKDFYSTIDNPS